jgi:hypothetical protein
MRRTFRERVDFAARYISSGRSTNRTFDGCFGSFDEDAVVTALYRRAQARPDTKMAKNLWRYISKESVIPTAEENAHRTDLGAWSAELIQKSEDDWRAFEETRQSAKRANVETLA